MVRQGQPRGTIEIAETDVARCRVARGLGFGVSQVAAFTRANLAEHLKPGVTRVILDIGDDTALASIVIWLTVMVPKCAVLAIVGDPATEPALIRCGATGVVCPAGVAAGLLAESVTGSR